MGYRSGLSAQFGIAAETTPGTAVTVTRFYEFLSESLKYDLTRLDSMGLKAGQAYKRVTRSVVSRVGAGGDVTLEHADQGMGLLWQHCLGSQATGGIQIGTTGAYRQIHTPNIKDGLGLTLQVGRPQTSDGTVKPFTYRGAKITDWEFTVSDGEIAQLAVTFDAWDETTATGLASASFDATTGVFTFADASTFTLGGTVTTTTGLTSITGGSAVATVMKGFTLTGSTPMATERFGLGNSGIKKNQIQNDIPTLTGKFDGEFGSQSEIYDLYRSNTTTPIQLDLAHGTAGTGQAFRLSIILPAVKFTSAPPQVDGPDLVAMEIDFEAYDDASNPPVQVVLVTNTSAL